MSIEHQTAPYEADAQMAYMVKEGIADFAITEDSDLIAFGCNKLVLKMNHKGFGELFDYDAFKNETNYKDWDEKLKTLQKMDRN
jgi:5'-3' exonuclease